MAVIPSFKEQQLQAICDVLGDAARGLSAYEIGRLFVRFGMKDPNPNMPKRTRLYCVLDMRQRNDQCANNIVAFVQAALEPTQFKGKQNQYDYLRERLNQALLSTGLQVGPEGKFYTVEPAHIPSETEQRVAHLRAELKRRDAHADVLRYCLPEMLENGYMPVIIACIQRLAEKIEEKTGLHGVGAHLVEDAFAPEHGARMAFNTLQTEAEAAEHIAILNLMKGMLEAFPDPTASRLSCSFNEKDTLDLLGLISLLHRRLDLAVPTE